MDSSGTSKPRVTRQDAPTPAKLEPAVCARCRNPVAPGAPCEACPRESRNVRMDGAPWR